MNRPPTLSVILPVRNAATTVGVAIGSILDSSFQDLELVIVDDGSTDRSAEVIGAFRDERVRILKNPTPGLCQALNLAVENCRAPFIARMDADDRSYPERFSVQLAAMDDHGWDIVGGLVRIVDHNNAPVPSYARYERWINSHRDDDSIRAHRFVESPLANPTTLAKREVYQQPFQDGPFPEDYDFWLRAIQRGFRSGKVNQIVLDWIDSPTRTTRNDTRYSPAAFDRCRRTHLQLGPLAGCRSAALWGAGQTGKPWLRWLRGAGYAVPWVVDVSPKKIGQRIHGTQVIAPDQIPPPDGTPLIVAVGAVGAAKAREEIATFLTQQDYRVGRDTWFVA